MASTPSHGNPLDTDEPLSSTGGLPPDFFDVPEPSASETTHTQPLPARGASRPARLAGAPSAPTVVIERRASVPVVLVVIAGNLAFFVGGGLAGWALAQKDSARSGAPAAAANASLSEVVRAIDAKASKSALEALTSRIGEVRLELGTLGRELARLEDRLNATPKAPAAPPTLPDLAPLQKRIDDLVEESQRLSSLPATFQSLRQRVDALDRGVNALHTEIAAVPKQFDDSLNSLKESMAARSASDQVRPADVGRNLGAALFREGKYAAAREVFLDLVQNEPDDARLWYFAALAHGMSSGDWTGEAGRMVRKGMASEQKGSPKRSDIDATFAELTKEQGKQWLDEWRKRIPR